MLNVINFQNDNYDGLFLIFREVMQRTFETCRCISGLVFVTESEKDSLGNGSFT